MEEKIFNLIEKLHLEIQDIKANMATRQDLADMGKKHDLEIQDIKANMATKQDLLGMATKQDLLGMATKQDLLGMATKKDIENMATKQDLADMRKQYDLEIQDIKANMATRLDIVRLENKLDDNLKALYDGYSVSIEGFNENRSKTDELANKVENHEIRLQLLELVK